jgi:cation diffusion facilitator family transporter
MFNTKVAASKLSIFSNASLVLFKLAVGFITGSISIISEAVHSGIDLLASVMTFFSVRVSDQPPDGEHPYGHGKIENITSIGEALLIFAAAIFIVYEASHKLLVGVSITAVPLGIGVMLLSAVVNFFISRKLFRVARLTDSDALEADAHHLSVDVYTSLGVLAGLGGVHFFNMPVLDPIVAIIVALFISKIAWDITRRSLSSIMDSSLPEKELATIKSIIQGGDERIKGFHKLRTRKAGAQRHVDLHIQVDKNLTVYESHKISSLLEDEITKSLPHCRVVVHIEPEPEKSSKTTTSAP